MWGFFNYLIEVICVVFGSYYAMLLLRFEVFIFSSVKMIVIFTALSLSHSYDFVIILFSLILKVDFFQYSVCKSKIVVQALHTLA